MSAISSLYGQAQVPAAMAVFIFEPNCFCGSIGIHRQLEGARDSVRVCGMVFERLAGQRFDPLLCRQLVSFRRLLFCG